MSQSSVINVKKVVFQQKYNQPYLRIFKVKFFHVGKRM